MKEIVLIIQSKNWNRNQVKWIEMDNNNVRTYSRANASDSIIYPAPKKTPFSIICFAGWQLCGWLFSATYNLTVHQHQNKYSWVHVRYAFRYFTGEMFWKLCKYVPIPKQILIPHIRSCSSVDSTAKGTEPTGPYNCILFHSCTPFNLFYRITSIENIQQKSIRFDYPQNIIMWNWSVRLWPEREHYQMALKWWSSELWKMIMFSKCPRYRYCSSVCWSRQWHCISFFCCFCSFNHLVNIRTDELLPIGARIYVFGNLSSKPFPLDDGRLRQKLIIKSKYIRFRGHDRHLQTKDENNVKILAKITSDVRHTDKYTLFTLASTHNPKYTDSTIYRHVICMCIL